MAIIPFVPDFSNEFCWPDKPLPATKKPLQFWKGLLECRRWDSNPHERNAHYALNVARLPVSPLRLSGWDFTNVVANVNIQFALFRPISALNFFQGTGKK